MPRHPRSMVRKEKYNRVFIKAIVFKLLQDRSNFLVHQGYAIEKTGQGFSNDWSVRIVWGKGDFFKVMNLAGSKLRLYIASEFVIRPNHGPALVRSH